MQLLTDRADERFRLFGHGRVAEPAHPTVVAAVDAHVARAPAAIAVRHGSTAVSYRELDRRAAVLAGRLAALGVREGDRVGLFLTRSVDMVVGLLATLRLGAAYVPQDARIAPPGHVRHIVRVTGMRVVLTSLAHVDDLPTGLDVPVVAVDAPGRGAAPVAVRSVDPAADAVVIFTSGTTGVPNGVAVTHANLANVVLTEPGSLGVRPGMTVAQVLNIGFDMAVWEVFAALAHGATLAIRGADIEAAIGAADVVIATPGVLAKADPRRCRRVSVVAVAGERCPLPLAEAWSASAAFHNCCGPTEVTIVNTISRYVPGSGELTIGSPIPNTTVYVLDDELRPRAIGEIGEMWAGGACVTRGYVGDDGLTRERYRPDPFLGGGHVMFRTRDLGRWTATGELEHHGRTDDQVKLRGFRIELDGVTAALERTPGCARATTFVRDGDLVAFVAPADVDPDAARRTVAAALPYYCVPAVVVAVDTLPLTSRGKVDRHALAAGLDRAETGPVGAVGMVAAVAAVADVA